MPAGTRSRRRMVPRRDAMRQPSSCGVDLSAFVLDEAGRVIATETQRAWKAADRSRVGDAMRMGMMFWVVLVSAAACARNDGERSTSVPDALESRARDPDASDSGGASEESVAATDPAPSPAPAPTLPSVVSLGLGDATLVGRVLDRDGHAWAGVPVVIVPDCADGATVATDASGGFSVRGLPSCPTVVLATADGASDEVVLRPSGKPMEVTLRPRCGDDVILIDARAATGSEPPPASARPKPPRRVPCPDRGRDRSRSDR